MGKLIAGGVILFFAGIWEALNYWHLIDSVITKLQSEGSVGMFLADLVTSPVVRLALILVGLGVVVKGFMEHRANARQAHSAPTLVQSTPVPPEMNPPKQSEKQQVVDI